MTALWTSAEIEAATGGRASQPFEVSGVTFDSREVEPGFLFVAMPGTVHDGHEFVAGAFERGAAGAIVSKPVDGPHVLVDDVVAALQALVLMGLEKRLRRRMLEPQESSVPPLLTLERFLFRLIAVGFLLLTLTLASGILFTEQLFGKALVLNHKSVFSVLGWLTFGGLLIGRWRYGWRGRVALRWIIAGTVFVFLAYLGSKFVLEVLLGR